MKITTEELKQIMIDAGTAAVDLNSYKRTLTGKNQELTKLEKLIQDQHNTIKFKDKQLVELNERYITLKNHYNKECVDQYNSQASTNQEAVRAVPRVGTAELWWREKRQSQTGIEGQENAPKASESNDLDQI